MKILLLLANSGIEEYFKGQKSKIDNMLVDDSVYFHSLSYNSGEDEVLNTVVSMKPDLIIYRHGVTKQNSEVLDLLTKIKKTRPACNIFILSENMSLIFVEALANIGIYELFIGKQIEVIKVVDAIISYWKWVQQKREFNKKVIENIAKDVQIVSREKNNHTFVIAENLLPEGIVSPGKKKRVSLMYHNLNLRNETFSLKFSIDYYDEKGVEKSVSYDTLVPNARKVIEELSKFEYSEEEFFEDYRYVYSSYDIIFDDFKVHGNMNWDGQYQILSEYTKFDKMKKISLKEIPYNIPYDDFMRLVESKGENKTLVQNTKQNTGFGFFGKKKK
mgnify:CR=1 FL=1